LAHLKDQVENALNEGRILLLGAQVVIGALFRATFEEGFLNLPASARALAIATLALLLVGLGLLLWPVSYHRIVERGEISRRFHALISKVVAVALLPLAISVGTFAYLVLLRTSARADIAAAGGVIMSFGCFFFWYGLEIYVRSRRSHNAGGPTLSHPEETPVSDDRSTTPLSEKIKDVLIECRIVLPGAQALLGFQFITVFMDRFQRLAEGLRYVHVASLFCVAVATVLLITPAAYHRIVEGGEETETFHRFAGWVLLAAMVFLGAGVSGDFLVVLLDQTGSWPIAMTLSAILLLFLYGLWFGVTLYLRGQRRREA
jgi:uncharacterized protein DUF6328